nr:immunoglobulin heavy chain junction region [Macaca mulatta]MOW76615.1 immunoglobulin heavy chain junction region [Macaca mulatta]MOW78021.1 immunoglobulin heavy chain junction region [Macaca mulatta]MOW79140.1 immunoglobulin heavy chain junction region [Macaca mulatta]MOW79654.1 immunoglobulin heavy chain junction region [Macaca mulatta]
CASLLNPSSDRW